MDRCVRRWIGGIHDIYPCWMAHIHICNIHTCGVETRGLPATLIERRVGTRARAPATERSKLPSSLWLCIYCIYGCVGKLYT